jgi:cytochrome P450
MLETLAFTSTCGPLEGALVLFIAFVLVEVGRLVYFSKLHALKTVPGPWFPAASSLWIRWQRWCGTTSFTANDLISRYGPIVRIGPKMVLVNDLQTLQSVFARQDLDTAPQAVRALRIGGHEWVLTHPQNYVARGRRRPIMVATTSKSLKYWHPFFEDNIATMVCRLGGSRGTQPEDIMQHLRVTTLLNSQVVMAGSRAKIEPSNFPHIVHEYNSLVVWRLCLPNWLFAWMKFSPFSGSRFRVRSSDLLFQLGEEVCRQAQATVNSMDRDEIPTVYQLLTERNEKNGLDGGIKLTADEISAEIAGQILAATDTTSSAVAYIIYELAKNPDLTDKVHDELQTVESSDSLESLRLLDACIKEGLRFRPPVGFTGSRMTPKGGLTVLGHYLPGGTVVTTQSLSMSRQRPDLFPDYDVYNPMRWLDEEHAAERQRLLVPFGIGARRCPGSNMGMYQMRLLVAAVIRAFKISVAPQTSPESMEPFEANGFRSRCDECYLIFSPRA